MSTVPDAAGAQLGDDLVVVADVGRGELDSLLLHEPADEQRLVVALPAEEHDFAGGACRAGAESRAKGGGARSRKCTEIEATTRYGCHGAHLHQTRLFHIRGPSFAWRNMVRLGCTKCRRNLTPARRSVSSTQQYHGVRTRPFADRLRDRSSAANFAPLVTGPIRGRAPPVSLERPATARRSHRPEVARRDRPHSGRTAPS